MYLWQLTTTLLYYHTTTASNNYKFYHHYYRLKHQSILRSHAAQLEHLVQTPQEACNAHNKKLYHAGVYLYIHQVNEELGFLQLVPKIITTVKKTINNYSVLCTSTLCMQCGNDSFHTPSVTHNFPHPISWSGKNSSINNYVDGALTSGLAICWAIILSVGIFIFSSVSFYHLHALFSIMIILKTKIIFANPPQLYLQFSIVECIGTCIWAHF